MEAMIAEAVRLNTDQSKSIGVLLESKKQRICKICSGRGHWADKCPLKRELDRHYRRTNFMATWTCIRNAAFK